MQEGNMKLQMCLSDQEMAEQIALKDICIVFITLRNPKHLIKTYGIIFPIGREGTQNLGRTCQLIPP